LFPGYPQTTYNLLQAEQKEKSPLKELLFVSFFTPLRPTAKVYVFVFPVRFTAGTDNVFVGEKYHPQLWFFIHILFPPNSFPVNEKVPPAKQTAPIKVFFRFAATQT
jgi:hypothetical protein